MKRVIAFLVAVSLAASLSACSDKTEKAYKNAVKLYNAEKYAEAKAAFLQLGNYEDSSVRVQKCDYEMATSMFLKGDYAGAQAAMEALNGFKNSTEVAQTCSYLLAQEAIRDGRNEEAMQRLKGLGSYLDSAALLAELELLEHAESLQGSWTASGPDLTELVMKALSEVEVTVTSPDDEEEEGEQAEGEEEDTDSENAEESKEEKPGEKLDLSSLVKLTPKPTSFALQLLPNSAFVLEMDGVSADVQTAIGMEVRLQIRKIAEDYVKDLAGDSDWKEYLEEQELSIDEFIAEYYGLDLDKLIEDCVNTPIQNLSSGLPMYGAYRLEDGKIVLAVGTNETSAVLDGSGKLALELAELGTLEFSKG